MIHVGKTSLAIGASGSSMPGDKEPQAIAVLLSGGIDSAVLVNKLCDRFQQVWPVYVRSGLIWEPAELAHLQKFLQALGRHEARPLHVIDLPVADIYGDHWAITGVSVPGHETPDEAVFLPGRNLFLISKTAVWCSIHDVGLVALGSLKMNPFADSGSRFDGLLSELIFEALGKRFKILRPFSHLSKTEVLELGADLPLELTFSCISPVQDRHCGRCNKCAERRRAFRQAGRHDPTRYVRDLPQTGG